MFAERAAFDHCVAITSTGAANFWHGIRPLPPEKRDAFCAVYAFARRLDDIADGCAPAVDRVAALLSVRESLRCGTTGDPVVRALRAAASRSPIPLSAAEDLVDGFVAEVRGAPFRSWNETLTRCRRIAGSTGRMAIGAFGCDDSKAPRFAEALGIAFQLTTILRDLREDARAGKIYLPGEELARWRVTLGPTDHPRALAGLVHAVAERARLWYATGLQLIPLLDARSAACCGVMAGVHSRMLHRIDSDPLAALRARVAVPTWERAA